MGMKKLVVKNGEYQKNGETKTRWLNIGVMGENDNGQYLILEPSINLAGLPRNDRGSVFVSVFEDRDQGAQRQSAPASNPNPGPVADDDMPF